jgi:RNA polymerase sigma-70 factor (ECF subfamily)
MPPFALWLEGPVEIGKWYVGQGAGCEGSRLLATAANGSPAFGAFKRDPAGGHSPFALQVLEVTDGRITGIDHFLYPDLFPAFGLPTHLDR